MGSRTGEQLTREALDRGWELVRGRRHIIVRWPPTNRQLVLPSSPSDWRGARNCRALMRKMEAEAPARRQPAKVR